MLTRTVKRLFTLRSRLDWVPKIFKHPKYNKPDNIKRSQKIDNPEYVEFKQQERDMLRKLKEKETIMQFELKVSQIDQKGLFEFSTREIIHLLKVYGEDVSKKRALTMMVKNVLKTRGYELSIYQLNDFLKYTFMYNDKMDSKNFIIILGLLGSYIGPDNIQRDYVQESFKPSFFTEMHHQKKFVNILHLLLRNYRSEDAIRSVPQCKSLLERFLYKIIRVVAHAVRTEDPDLHLQSALHLLLVCSKYLPVGFYPDPKVIPYSVKYDRPPEVLQDKAWSEDVKALLSKVTAEIDYMKFRDISVYVEVHDRMGMLDNNTFDYASNCVQKTLNTIQQKNSTSTYIINRLALLHQISKNQNEKLNSLIKEALQTHMQDYIQDLVPQLESLKDSINNSWTRTSLDTQRTSSGMSNKLISDINQLPGVFITFHRLGLDTSQLKKILENVLTSFAGVLEIERVPLILEAIEMSKGKSEVVEKYLQRAAEWVSLDSRDVSTFKYLDSKQLVHFRDTVVKVLPMAQANMFDDLVHLLEDQINHSSRINS
jgi:hypothetical protein